MTCADKLGIPVSSLLAIVSVATLSLSLAAQGVLANVFGGVILLITKPFKAGEYVEINGVAGSVSKMGLSYTEIVTVDNRRIVIPNSEMSTSKISNYSCEETRRVDVDFATAYTASTEEVKKAVAAAAAQIPTVLQDPAPVVLLNQFADGGIKYQVRVYCPNAKYWDTYFALTEAVRKGLTEAGIGMSYSHVNVHVEK